MKEETFFIDDKMIDDYLFTNLVELGYAPTPEEVENITDLFIMLLSDIGVISEEEYGEGRENWR
jgi:hypothetical protein